MTFITLALAWLVKNKKILIYIGIAIAILISFLYLKSCFKKEPKIDIETIQKVNSQNEKERQAELKKVIEENSDVVKTVDQRNTITETNVEQRDKEIEQKIKEVDKKIEEVKSQKGDISESELKCLLIPENCK